MVDLFVCFFNRQQQDENVDQNPYLIATVPMLKHFYTNHGEQRIFFKLMLSLYRTGIDFTRQILKSTYVRIRRAKSIPVSIR